MQPARRSGNPPHRTPIVRRPILSAAWARVAHHDCLAWVHAAETGKGGREDVGMGFRPLGMIGRGSRQVGYADNLLVAREFVGFRRRGERNPLAVGPARARTTDARQESRTPAVNTAFCLDPLPGGRDLPARKTGMGWSPPLPICERTSWPKCAKASC